MSPKTRIGIVGAGGRMGATACRAVEGDDDLELVARVGRGDPLDALVARAVDVAVDFTTPDAVKDNVRFCVYNDIHAVVGTSGLTEEDVGDLDKWTAGRRSNVFIAPNFAIGAVLMMVFATHAARRFDSAEIVERHHPNKVDAPSGTALRTAALMSEARGRAWASAAGRESRRGARGGDEGGVRIHSLRVAGSVAHQEVIFGGQGETLTIRHDSIDRSSFMPGVLLAIKNVASLDGVTVGLERLLEL
ncbi:MAG: 4-hydroxy-tetrahydrodipicolinate reductase [Actinomycetota bacterium]